MTCASRCRFIRLATLALSVVGVVGCGKSDSGGGTTPPTAVAPPTPATQAASVGEAGSSVPPLERDSFTFSYANNVVDSAMESLKGGMERLDDWLAGEPSFNRKQRVTLTEEEVPELIKRTSRANELMAALDDEARICERFVAGTQEVREDVLKRIEKGVLKGEEILPKWKCVRSVSEFRLDRRNAVHRIKGIREKILEGTLTLGDLELLTRIERFGESARKVIRQQTVSMAQLHRFMQCDGLLMFSGDRFKGPFTKFEDVPRLIDLHREENQSAVQFRFKKVEQEEELRRIGSNCLLGSAEKAMEFESAPAILVALRIADDGKFGIVDVVGGDPITTAQVSGFFAQHTGEAFAYVTIRVINDGNLPPRRVRPFTTKEILTQESLLPPGGCTVEEAIACVREFYMRP